MKNKFLKVINWILVMSMLLSQSSMAFANMDGAVSNPQADVSLIQPTEENSPALSETAPVEATPNAQAGAVDENKNQSDSVKQDEAKNSEENPEAKEETSSEATPSLEGSSGFRNAVVPVEYADFVEGFTYYIQPQYLGSEKIGDKTYVSWNYKIVYTKPPTFTGKNMDKLYAYVVTTKDSGLGQPQIVAAKKNGANIAVPTATVSGNSDLMKSLKIAVDPKQDANAQMTTYEFTVKAPVEQIRDFYGADFYGETLFRKPRNAGMFAMPTGTREVVNARTGSDPNLLSINNEGNSVYVATEGNDGRLVAGDYTSTNKITWLESHFNDKDTAQNFPVNITVDKSQTVDSVRINYYRPTQNGNGYILERTETSNASLNSVHVPAGYIAQVEVKTTVTNEKVNHTMSEAELESLKADLTIQKNWQTGSRPTDTYFKLTGGVNNALNENITISASKNSYVKANLLKFTGFDKNATRVSYTVEELSKPTYELVYSSFDEKTLTYTFENKSVQEESKPSGICKDYGVISLDPVEINEFVTNREGGDYYAHDGKISGRFRIPKEAKAGDYFILDIPKEIDIKHDPDVSTKFFDMIGKGKKIGEVFHIDTHKLKFVLNANAYSTQDYEGTFTVGEAIPRVGRDLMLYGGKVIRIDGSTRIDANKTYYKGIQPNRNYFYDERNRNADFVRKTLNFKSTYYDRKRISEDCERPLSTTGTASYRDKEVKDYRGMHKKMLEITEDYIIYDVIFNPTGQRGWADGLFVDQLSDTIELYSGARNPRSLQTDVKVYEVQGLANLGYVAGSEKQIWPRRDAGVTANVTVGLNDWNGSRARQDYAYGALRRNGINRGDQVTFNFSNTGSKTMLARIKVKTVPNFERKYGGRVLNFLWTDKANKFGGPYDFVGHDEYLTSGNATGNVIVKETKYELNLNKVDSNANLITNNSAVFRLTNNTGQTIGEYFTDKTGTLTIGGLERYIKARDGSKTGVYYLEEVQAPNGYVREKTVYKIFIDKTGKMFFGKKGSPQNENEFLAPVQKGQAVQVVNKKGYIIKVNKLDDQNAPLTGAKFNLRNQTGSYNFTTLEKTQSTFTFYNLAPGDYTLTEVEAPAGYKGLTTPITFTIGEDGSVVQTSAADPNVMVNLNEADRVFELSVVNRKVKTGEFSLTKVSDVNEVLAGAVFKLTPIAPAGTAIEKTSNSTGKVRFADLNPGRYRLEEKSAPDGYKKTDVTWIVEVNDKGQTTVKVERTNKPVTNNSPNPDHINFDVMNKKEKRFGFELPKTGGTGVVAIKVIGLGFILGAAYFLVRKKKRH